MQLSMRRPLLALSLALCCVTLAGASPTSSQAQPAAPTLERLLAGFASMTGMSARFVEEKQIALLARPIRSEGVLYFTAPGRLMRLVTSPTVSAIPCGRCAGSRTSWRSAIGGSPSVRW